MNIFEVPAAILMTLKFGFYPKMTFFHIFIPYFHMFAKMVDKIKKTYELCHFDYFEEIFGVLARILGGFPKIAFLKHNGRS